jgi:hypothetical protein
MLAVFAEATLVDSHCLRRTLLKTAPQAAGRDPLGSDQHVRRELAVDSGNSGTFLQRAAR